MTYIKESFTDSLSLDSVKAHLNITFTEDDTLIGSYLSASLLYMEKSTNRVLRPLKYMATSEELLPVVVNNLELFVLHLPNTPYEVTLNTTTYDDLNEMYEYVSTEDTLFVEYDDTITDIEAMCGTNNTPLVEVELINQARLMLIGNWYGFREADITATINEVPNGVTRIVDILSSTPL